MSKLLRAMDQAGKIRNLNEALYMAFSDIDDMDQRNALQMVSDVMNDEFKKLDKLLDDLRERDGENGHP